MSKVIFTINEREYEADGRFGPEVSLNDYIRTVADLRGTKSMCHEGGCGACVVSVRAPLPPSNEIKTFSVNSCLVSVLSCHGWEVTTVEGLGSKTIGYNEIQTRLASFNGTQCGFCTPGWIMGMHSLKENNKQLTMKEIQNSFASNLCRCTGYRPIIDAFNTFAIDTDQCLIDKLTDLEDLNQFKSCGVKCKKNCHHKRRDDVIEDKVEAFSFMDDDKMFEIDTVNNHRWYKAYTLDDVFEAMANGDYKLIAGNTGQGIYHVTEYPETIIDISSVSEIKGFVIDVNLIMGAGMTLSEMMDLFLRLSKERDEFQYLSHFYDHMDLVAHIPVRNIGTIAGNLMLKHTHNSFQSDVFLIFEVVGAVLTIAEKGKTTTVTLPEFLKLDMNQKVVTHVMLPPLSENCTVRTYKVMPRAQNAHAIINAAFLFKFKDNSELLESATIVYGSVSSTFIHAKKTEALLVGRDPFTNETLQLAVTSLYREIIPEDSPPEPSPAYRKMLAVSLFYKAIIYLCPEDKIDPRYKSGGECMKRCTSSGVVTYDTDKSLWPLNQPVSKMEGLIQCSGEATYANDLPTQKDEVFGAFVTADVTPGSVVSGFDTTEAMKVTGVITFYSAKDIPGNNTFTCTKASYVNETEEILCSGVVKYFGQPVGILVADSEKTAKNAASLVTVNYSSISTKKPLLTVEDVKKSSEKDTRITAQSSVSPTTTGSDIRIVISGEFQMESQYHFFMEPQTCVVKPTDNGMDVYSATQYLNLTNIVVAECLNIPINSVNVIVRHVGGSYGGKISRSPLVACSAALVAHLLGKPCRFIVPLQTNMKAIGKRIPTCSNFEVGVNKDGVIQYLTNSIYQNAGTSLNDAYTSLILTPFYSCYEHTSWKVDTYSVITDIPSNTWCRAPFTTEGVAMIELIMDKIAFYTGVDALQVRRNNMSTSDNPLPEMIDQIITDSNYEARKTAAEEFNKENRWRKRAIKLLPMTVDLFFPGNYNSIVSIFSGDGTVTVTHAGIEMGQGLNTKVAQVCAYTLGVPLEKVNVQQSCSTMSPNAIMTGGSVGSESVALATLKACETLNLRLQPYVASYPVWEDRVLAAFTAGIDLQATYMATPLHDSISTYYVYATCVLELEIDLLTGNHNIIRVDLLEDAGRSMSPEIDMGQIQGAFLMGLGLWSSESLVYDSTTGELLTDRTWTYKPPGLKDIPQDMRISFRKNATNSAGVLNSKGTAEPALCAASVFTSAVREAVRASRLEAGYEDKWLQIENPNNAQNIFLAAGHKLKDFVLKEL